MLIKIILILIIFYINGLRSNKDFCFKNEKEICTGIYDQSSLKYTKNCEKITCQSPLTYDCTENFCTNKMKDCKFLNWHSSIFKSNTERFSFQKCFISNIKFSDFCLNGKNCLRRITLETRNLTRKFSCLCPNDKSFICGKYCTKNSIICKAIKISNKQQNNNSISCGNSDSIYLQKTRQNSHLIRF